MNPQAHTVKQWRDHITRLAHAAQVTIHYDDLLCTMDAYYLPNEREIHAPNITDLDSYLTALHECAHAILQHPNTRSWDTEAEYEHEANMYVAAAAEHVPSHLLSQWVAQAEHDRIKSSTEHAPK